MSEREELEAELRARLLPTAWGKVSYVDQRSVYFAEGWQAAHRTVSGQEARNTILHEVAAIVEGLPGDCRPWDCAQTITDMTRDAAPIPATDKTEGDK